MSFLGNAGPWRDRIYLVGGLAPRYIVGKLPEGVPAHIGTTDVDLVIEFLLDDASLEAYWTLATNLKNAGFMSLDSCRWAAEVDGVKITLEFLCDTDEVEPGGIFKPKGQKLGSKLGAFNIPGSALASLDYREYELDADRIDGTGRSQDARVPRSSSEQGYLRPHLLLAELRARTGTRGSRGGRQSDPRPSDCRGRGQVARGALR